MFKKVVEILAIGLLSAAPLSAQTAEVQLQIPSPKKDYASLGEGEFREEVLRVLQDQSLPDCTVRFPVLAEAAKREPEYWEIARARDEAEIWCLAQLERYDLAQDKSIKFEQAYDSMFNVSFFLQLAYHADDADNALYRLRWIIENGNEPLWASLEPQLFYHVSVTAFRGGYGDQIDALFFDMVERDIHLAFKPIIHDFFVSGGLDHSLAQSDLEGASRMLERITAPSFYQDYIADRKYTELWPQIEARVGPNFKRITSDDRAIQEAKLAANPTDLAQQSMVAHALMYDRDYKAAIEFADRILARGDLAETLQEDEGWVLQIKAYALDALGRTEEADDVYDFFTQFDPETNPWVVSFVINRATRLIGQGRLNEGLAAAELAEPIAREFGSPFAKLLIANAQICGLYALGRLDEAMPQLAFLEENKTENYAISVDTLLCTDRPDEAAQLLHEGLDDEIARESVLGLFVPAEFNLSPNTTIFPTARDLILEREDLRARFEEGMRIVPDEFLPLR